MDNLPIETTAKIMNFLPWKDKLASRQLSSKFERLLVSNPIEAGTLSIEQSPNVFSVSYTINHKSALCHIVESRTIRIENDPGAETKNLDELTVCRSRNTKETRIDGKVEKKIEAKTIVQCDGTNFRDRNSRDGNSRLAAEICMRPFVAYFSCRIFNLAKLDNYFLSKLLAILVEIRPDFAENSEMSLCFRTYHRKISQGERKLLTLFKNLKLFEFSHLPNFKVSGYFWDIPCIRNTKKLVILFEKLNPSGNLVTADVDFGVDDDLLESFIAEKRICFQCNAVSRITANFLINYISNCLRGGYAMRDISIAHRLSLEELARIESFLKDNGFTSRVCQDYGMYWEQKTTEDEGHPSPLSIYLSDKDLSIWS